MYAKVQAKALTGLVSTSLNHLSLLNLVLDPLLLKLALLCISPPHRALVFASNAEIDTGTTCRVILITLLATQTTCKTA